MTNSPGSSRGEQARARRGSPNEAQCGGRPKARGTRAEAEGNETSEGCVRATKSGNGRHTDPAEQRRPVSGMNLRRE